MFRIVAIMIFCVGVIFGTEAQKTPKCNACYDRVLQKTKGINILQSGKDYYDATLISLGFAFGGCVVIETHLNDDINCDNIELVFETFRDKLTKLARSKNEGN